MGTPLLNSSSEFAEKLRDNTNAVIGQSQPMMEHKEQLSLVEAFILKVQRHANIFPLTPHAPKKDFTYKGHYLSKDSFIYFLYWILL